jgi:hypothetical protein
MAMLQQGSRTPQLAMFELVAGALEAQGPYQACMWVGLLCSTCKP